ncbi:MAG: ketosteroid isomerase-related protein [Pseudomonadota bacterium]
MTAAATRDLITRYYDAFNRGDTDAMLALVTDDIIHDVNQGGERRIGKDRFAAFNARMTHHYEETLSDLVIFVAEDGARAAAEFNVSGTYRMTEDGLPPARDQTYQLPAGTFFAVDGDLITRITTYYNLTDWITQVSTQR